MHLSPLTGITVTRLHMKEICRELYGALSKYKYMELTEDNFQVEINRTQVIITFLGEET